MTYTRKNDISVVQPLQAVDDVVSNPRVLEAAESTDHLAKVFRAWSTVTLGGAVLPTLLWNAGTRTLSIVGADLELHYITQDLNTPSTVARKTVLRAGDYIFGANTILLLPLGLGSTDIAISPPNIVLPPGSGTLVYASGDAQAQASLAATLLLSGADRALAMFQFARVSGQSLSLFNRIVLRNGVPVLNGYADTQYINREDIDSLWRAVNQDRNLIITGGGDVGFALGPPLSDTAVVTFSSSLRILLPTGIVLEVAVPIPHSMSRVQNLLTVTIPRITGTAAVTSLSSSNLAAVSSSADNRVLILAVWLQDVEGDRLYWVNGNVHRNGDTFPIGLSGRIPFIEAAEGAATVNQFDSVADADTALLPDHERIAWIVDTTTFPDGVPFGEPAVAGDQPLTLFTPVTRASLDARKDFYGVDFDDYSWEALRAYAFIGNVGYLNVSSDHLAVLQFNVDGTSVRGSLWAGEVWTPILKPGEGAPALIEGRDDADGDTLVIDTHAFRADQLRKREGVAYVEVRNHNDTAYAGVRAEEVVVSLITVPSLDPEYVVVVQTLGGVSTASLQAYRLAAVSRVTSPLFSGGAGLFSSNVSTPALWAYASDDVIEFLGEGGVDYAILSAEKLVLRSDGSGKATLGLRGVGVLRIMPVSNAAGYPAAGPATLEVALLQTATLLPLIPATPITVQTGLVVDEDVVAADGFSTTDGDITTTNGDITAGGNMTAGADVVAAVNVTATAGDVTAGYNIIAGTDFLGVGNAVVRVATVKVPADANTPAFLNIQIAAGTPAVIVAKNAPLAIISFENVSSSPTAIAPIGMPGGITQIASIAVSSSNLRTSSPGYVVVDATSFYVCLPANFPMPSSTKVAASGVLSVQQGTNVGIWAVAEAEIDNTTDRRVKLTLTCVGHKSSSSYLGVVGDDLTDLEAIPAHGGGGSVDMGGTALIFRGSLTLYSVA